MKNKATTFKATVEREIRMRYTCEHCKKDTDWIYYNLIGKADVAADGRDSLTPEAAEELLEKAKKNLAEIIEFAKLNLPKGQAMGPPFFKISAVCPSCNHAQSWRHKDLSVGWVLAPSLICLIALLGKSYLFAGIMFLLVVISIIGNKAFFSLRDKKLKELVENGNLPEFDFGEETTTK